MSKAKYILRVKTEFSAAHKIVGYNGNCARLHGHNWEIEAVVTATAVNDIGIAYDFKDLKSNLRSITDKLDHRHLNEIKPFDVINPTAENLACWLFGELSKKINDPQVKLRSIVIWENQRSAVEYTME